MIDDDFETVFRRMIEHFMGSIGDLPDGSTTVRYWTSSNFAAPNVIEESQSDEDTDVEIIDLDDRVLVIVNLGTAGFVPSVRAEGKKLIVLNELEEKETVIELDFLVDVENSYACCRNGILEIVLKEAELDSTITKGYLNFQLRG